MAVQHLQLMQQPDLHSSLLPGLRKKIYDFQKGLDVNAKHVGTLIFVRGDTPSDVYQQLNPRGLKERISLKKIEAHRDAFRAHLNRQGSDALDDYIKAVIQFFDISRVNPLSVDPSRYKKSWDSDFAPDQSGVQVFQFPNSKTA